MDVKKIPNSLRALKGFEATARLQSIRGAAKELNLTHTAVRYQIQSLEDNLGVLLFRKDGRNIALTEQGRILQGYVAEAFEVLIKGVEAVQVQGSEAPLRVYTYVTLALQWLAPRLVRFRSEYPQVNLEIISSTSDWSFDETSGDVGLVYCETPPSSSYCWQPLFENKLVPVCSPSLFGEGGVPLSPEKALSQKLISVSCASGYWQEWLGVSGLEMPVNSQPIVADSESFAIEMALRNEGIAIVSGPFVEKELAEKSLIDPFKLDVKRPGAWGVIYPKSLQDNVNIRYFCDWLKTEV